MSLYYDLVIGENLTPTDNWFVIFDETENETENLKRFLVETEEHIAKRRKFQKEALIPQVPKQLESKIMEFIHDLEYMERHQRLTQLLVLDFHKQVHQYARVDCWCGRRGEIEICRCIQGMIMPQRITRARRSYWGYGYRDLVLEWVWKIRDGWYILRCTACTSVCECTSYFPERLRNGQRITHDFCDGRLLSWVLQGRRECLGKSKEKEEMCAKCRGTKLIWTDYLQNSEINIRY
jgi:hypothetical protein